MDQIWQRIEDWLKANYPEILDDLILGATVEEIAEVEEHIQISFPHEFKVSYLIHNGQEGDSEPLMDEWELLSLEYIVNEWDLMKDLYDRGDFKDVPSKPIDGSIKPNWWNLKWIPVASNGAGDLICLDLDPGSTGKTGQIISFWHMDEKRERIADSFEVWLLQFINDVDR